MQKLKMHAKRELSYDPQTVGIAWTLCFRNVEQEQIAVSPESVTCKKCLAHIAWSAANDREWAARHTQAKVL